MNKILIDSKKVQLDIGIEHPDGSVGGHKNCIVLNTENCTFEYTLKDNLVEYRLSFKALTEDGIGIVTELKEFLRLEEVHFCTQQNVDVKYCFSLTYKIKNSYSFFILDQFDNCIVTDWDIQDDFVVISGKLPSSEGYGRTEYDSEEYHFAEMVFD